MFDEKKQLRLAAEWEKFTATGEADNTVVREFILDSWSRSRRYGVDPFMVLARRVDPAVFGSILEAKKRFVRISLPVIENLYRFIENSRSIIILADENGVILSRTGDPEYLVNSSAYDPGVEYSERTVGTNGIGTSIVLGEPLQIWAQEHFARRNHELSCAAAPIRDPDGRVAGCLNISSPWNSVHQHTLAMIVAAANSVEQQLRIESELLQKTRLLQEKEGIFELIEDGLFTIDGALLVKDINERARRMLRVTGMDVCGRPVTDFIRSGVDFSSLIESGHRVHMQEATLGLHQGILACSFSATPIETSAGLVVTVREAKSVRRMVNRYSGSKAVFTFGDIAGESPQIHESLRLAEIAGQSDTNVLILGESGTGKEMFAQAIHNGGSRWKGPFVAVNCGALPRDLIQSELFGYGEGAFTGARKEGNPGKFELADGGTIFLDEIGEMPLAAQVNLLRVVENKEVIRIGDSHARPIDVRIIAATNRSLMEAIAEKSFREDLYYRLNVLTINLPPLRHRSGDVDVLVDYFLNKIGNAPGRQTFRMGTEAMALIRRYGWPGNIRELENIIERAAHLCQGSVVRPVHLGRELMAREAVEAADQTPLSQPGDVWASTADSGIMGARSLHDSERDNIYLALRQARGNIKKAAEQLGIARSTMYLKVRRHGINVDELR